jgi:hypothetical protein
VTVWSPLALITLAALVAAALATRGSPRTGRPGLIAVALLTAFTAWSFMTIAWAGVRGDAWEGANKTLLYLLVFALVSMWPATTGAIWRLLIALSLCVAIQDVVTIEQFIRSSDPSQFAIGTRLSEPLGYPNATGALSMMLIWPLVGVASRRWIPPWARGLACGLASIHASVNLLTESRGSLFTLPFVALVFFLVVPGRMRSLVAVAVVSIGFAPVIRPILHVYSASPADVSATLRRAIDLALVWAVLTAAAGWTVAWVDLRRPVSASVTRVAGAIVAAALVLSAAAAIAVGQPWAHTHSAWHSFKYGGEPSSVESHFGGIGSARYDIWRVALSSFADHPVQGIGVDNFLVPYLERRRSNQQPLYPHSLAIRLLSQTGIVGTLLFAAFIAAAFRAALRAVRPQDRELAGILLAGVGVWLLHGLVDWLWEMPVLSMVGMAFLGMAAGLGRPPGGLAVHRRRFALGAAVAVPVTAATLALPWLAARDVHHAEAIWPQDPGAAFAALHRATRLNPLSDEADVTGGAIASHLHRYARMRLLFGAAVSRSPDDWYANLELGIAASLTGDRALAGRAVARAHGLNPREPIVRRVQRDLVAGRRIDPDSVDRAFLAE